MEAHKVYDKLLQLAENGELDIRTEINDYDKAMTVGTQVFVGHDKVEFFFDKKEVDKYEVWHYISNDGNYEYLEVVDIINNNSWYYEDKKV